MKNKLFAKLCCVGLVLANALPLSVGLVFAQDKIVKAKEITFCTEDGIKIYGDVYESAGGKKAPLILLFHQGDGNAKGEYGGYIARRLIEKGFNVIAIDQRIGGGLFNGTNRTVGDLKGKEFGYCDAYPDLKAALQFAKKSGFNGKRIAWGSSYSATLALRLAGEFPNDVDGVLAFSPAGGEEMAPVL